MSSGNYKEYYPETWFDFNRSNLIEAFNKKPKVKRRNAKIKALKKKLID